MQTDSALPTGVTRELLTNPDGQQVLLHKVTHACGHSELDPTPFHLLPRAEAQARAAKLTSQDCLACQNRAYNRARRAAHKAAQ